MSDHVTHPDQLVENQLYAFTTRDGKVVNARFLGLHVLGKRLVLKCRANGVHGFLPWLQLACADRYEKV